MSSSRARKRESRSLEPVLATRIGAVKARSGSKANRVKPRSRRRPGRFVIYFGCHGGTGSTTIATSMGAELAREGLKTCLIDLDLQFGDILMALNLRERSPISDLLVDRTVYSGTTIDRDALSERLPRHSSGLRILSQVGCVEGLGQVTPTAMSAFAETLRSYFDVILIDGVRDFSDIALSVLDLADSIMLVSTQNVASLRGLMMRLEIFARLGYSSDDLMIIINRFRRRHPATLAAIEDSLGVTPAFTVAENVRAVDRALNEGRTLHESALRSSVRKSITKVTESLFAAELAARRQRVAARAAGSGRKSR